VQKSCNKSDNEGFVVVYPNGHFDPQFFSYWIKTYGVIYSLDFVILTPGILKMQMLMMLDL